MNKGAVYSGLMGTMAGAYMVMGGGIFQIDPAWGSGVFAFGALSLFNACLILPIVIKEKVKVAKAKEVSDV